MNQAYKFGFWTAYSKVNIAVRFLWHDKVFLVASNKDTDEKISTLTNYNFMKNLTNFSSDKINNSLSETNGKTNCTFYCKMIENLSSCRKILDPLSSVPFSDKKHIDSNNHK